MFGLFQKKGLGLADIQKELTLRKAQEQNYDLLTEMFEDLNNNDTTEVDDIIKNIKEAAEKELTQAKAVLNAFDENIKKVDLNKFKKGFIEEIKKEKNTGIRELEKKIGTTQEDIVEYLLYYRNNQSVVNTKTFIEKKYPRFPARKNSLKKSLGEYFKQVESFENKYRQKRQVIMDSLMVDDEVYDITPPTHTTTPHRGGKRRKSRRNRKSKKSKKSRKNHRKSNRRR